MALNSAINTGALGTGFIYNNGAGLLSAGPGMLVTKYTASNTWTINSKTQVVTVIAWNAGSGGGSGRQGSSTAASGGGSGAPGAFVMWTSLASSFNPAGETVTIGGGGAGGLTQATPATNGNPGTGGTASSLGNIKCGIVANPFGAGGTTSSGTAGSTQLSYIVSSSNTSIITQQATSAGSAGASSNSGGMTYSVNNASYTNGGGAGGSGADSVTARQAGNGQGILIATSATADILSSGGAGGIETGTINGGNGIDNISTTGGRFIGATGGGGGGGQKSGGSAGTGGNGGAGGGGGGGGGGSIDGTTSGAGGSGGRGELWVIEYFG